MAQDFFVDPTTVSLFTTAYDQEFVDESAFYASATPAESAFLSSAWGAQREVRRRQPGGEPLAEHHGQQQLT